MAIEARLILSLGLANLAAADLTNGSILIGSNSLKPIVKNIYAF